MKMYISLFMLFAMMLSAAGDILPKVRVEGAKIMAGGKQIRFRGINWGWWHHKGTVYTENDMRNQAAWGANVLRLAFSYFDVINSDGSWNEEAFLKVDEVVKWAAKYRQYVILDLHLAPGGQNPMPNPDGLVNLIWTEKKYQDYYLNLWAELARRYRNNPVVAAYEVMNEPRTDGKPEILFELNRKVVAKIRENDPEKTIVLSGDGMGHVSGLTDGLKVDDKNVIYTFHFYEGAWLGNVTGKPLSSMAEWTQMKLEIEVPFNATEMNLMLRTDLNKGTAWFDDLELTDSTGKILFSSGFDESAKPFSVERYPQKNGSYDAKIGHTKPGSLRIGGTTSYNSWRSPVFRVKGGQTYTLTAWVKLQDATGQTYLAAALFGSAKYTPEDFARLMKPAIDFGKKFEVPVWVGEFSIQRSHGGDLQAQAIADRIEAFERYGMSWTYWNFRETTNPDSMALHAQKRDGGDYPINEPLLKVLKEGWRKNAQSGR